MTKLRYLLMADNAIIDQMTSKLTAVGIFDQISIQADKSSVLVSFCVATQIFDLDKSKVKITVKIVDSSNGDCIKEQTSPETETENQMINVMTKFNALEFVKTSTYRVEIWVDGERVKSDDGYSFNVIKK